jgi:hypothetical protein
LLTVFLDLLLLNNKSDCRLSSFMIPRAFFAASGADIKSYVGVSSVSILSLTLTILFDLFGLML